MRTESWEIYGELSVAADQAPHSRGELAYSNPFTWQPAGAPRRAHITCAHKTRGVCTFILRLKSMLTVGCAACGPSSLLGPRHPQSECVLSRNRCALWNVLAGLLAQNFPRRCTSTRARPLGGPVRPRPAGRLADAQGPAVAAGDLRERALERLRGRLHAQALGRERCHSALLFV